MRIRPLVISGLAVTLSIASLASPKVLAQTAVPAPNAAPESKAPTAPKVPTAQGAWEFGPFANGGFGDGNRSSFKFFDVGVHAGKVLTKPWGPGLMNGQFEYAAELVPFWQSYTPAAHLENVSYVQNGVTHFTQVPVSGGTYTGVSITPIILRWNFKGTKKVVPFVQGAGGLIWTNHKYPPDYMVPKGVPGRTSVFNFTPQFGIGFHYFVRPKGSITFGANAVHISSASLGDRNPGVNASVQFQVGYTWWR
ncbi:MAG TPA: acyloxyacyl hydrolase [Acidisarcina sp.]|nr:acyloxyacyl hydrolase [Acidisarcina sp.]